MSEPMLAAAVLILAATTLIFWRSLRSSRTTVKALREENSTGGLPVHALETNRHGRSQSSRSRDVLERLEDGVLVFEEGPKLTMVNPSAEELLRRALIAGPDGVLSDELLELVNKAQRNSEAVEQTINQWPSKITLRTRAIPLGAGGGVAVVVRDITDEIDAARIRRQFVANASHELKSPVASLRALAEVIHGAADEDPDAASRFSKKLVFEADRLSRLVGDLLDLSKLEDPTNIPTKVTDLSSIAHTAGEQAKELATAREMTLECNIAPDILVTGNDQQLELMIRNLLDNGLRYTPATGTVSLSLRSEGDDAVLEIKDTGIGIPLEAQGHVFERFYRVDRDRSRSGGGTGLGLSIVKHVVELHRGNVSLKSELGSGSTFTVRLPAATPPARRRAS
jgi:two-component system, OmpR family, phosphate regulon sensor histidine kinase PhoR